MAAAATEVSAVFAASRVPLVTIKHCRALQLAVYEKELQLYCATESSVRFS